MSVQDTPSPSRRNLLKMAGATAAGFTMGFELPGAAQAAGGFAPNAFIRIDPTGRVTLTMPQQEMGQGINTALSQLLADELDVAWSQVVIEAAPPNDMLYGSPRRHVQSTGGSTSIRNFYTAFRKAGAGARAVLVQTAAKGWKVDPAACRTENGVVRHDASGRTATYGSLSTRTGGIKPPADPPLKPQSALRYIGKPVKRLDAPDKVTGKAQYAIDVMAGQVQVATLRICPVVGGKVRSVDDTKAKLVPGVRQIVVLDNLVAVVGDHMWAAKKGLDALVVTWNEGPNATINSAQIWREARQASIRDGAVAKTTGDIKKDLARGKLYEAAYEMPLLAHAPMEPLNTTVHVTPGRCEIWTGTQVQTGAQAIAAKTLGIPQDKVTLHNYMLGGGFGRRLDVDMVVTAVRIGQKVSGPVKVIWTREEDIRHDTLRPLYRNVMSASLDRGKIAGWKHRVVAGSVSLRMYGRGPRNGVDGGSVDGATDQPYDIPSWQVEYTQSEPRAVNLGWWRGVGPNNNVFAIESFVDELAIAAKKDPIEFRLAMLAKEPRLQNCLRIAREKSNWGAPLSGRVGRGVGIQNSFGSFMATVAEVEVDKNGVVKVRRYTSVIDCGAVVNPDTVQAQIMGGIMFGLSAALYGDVTVERGRIQQSNFHDYRVLRIHEAPPVDVHIVQSNAPPGGVGEPGTTAAIPCLANAIAAATGIRLRKMPIDREILAGRKKA